MKKKFNSTKRVGKGIRNNRISFIVSENLNLNELRQHAESKNLSLDELLNTAAVIAYSKMNLPENK